MKAHPFFSYFNCRLSKMITTGQDESKCRVCGGQIQKKTRHFGAEGICQPCALFFGRSSKREFQCKNAEKCKLFAEGPKLSGKMQSTARNACKSCRIAKCLQMGMGMRNDKMPQMCGGNELHSNVDSLIKSLTEAENSAQILFGKARVFSGDLPVQFRSMRELLTWNCNLVEVACRISMLTDESAHSMLSAIAENGNFSFKSQPILGNLIAVVHSFKALPFFHKIDINDQVCLLNFIAAPLYELCIKFGSSRLNSEVVVLKHPDGFSPLWAFRSDRYRGDRAIQHLSNSAMHTSMGAFNRVGMDEAEFLLLKMIIAAHSAASGLSSHAIDVLQSEKENYATVLMRLSRQRLGDMDGARRYAEVVHLAESVFHSAQKIRQLNAYVAMVTDQGRFHSTVPRAFINMCLHGEGAQYPLVSSVSIFGPKHQSTASARPVDGAELAGMTSARGGAEVAESKWGHHRSVATVSPTGTSVGPQHRLRPHRRANGRGSLTLLMRAIVDAQYKWRGAAVRPGR